MDTSQFTLRGKNGSRLESLSDGVFALTITLLVISTEVPATFEAMKVFLNELFPFVLCLLMIMWIWRKHHEFFRRYGLIDNRIITLNTLLLAVVLFYVYPLKFVFKWLSVFFGYLFMGLFIDQSYYKVMISKATAMISFQDMPALMIIYGVALFIIFITFYFMYRHVYKKRELLELTHYEVGETILSTKINWALAILTLTSIFCSVVGLLTHRAWSGMISGWIYALIGPLIYIVVKKHEKKWTKS